MTPKFCLQIKLSVKDKAHEKFKSGMNSYFSIRRVQFYLYIYIIGNCLKIGAVAGTVGWRTMDKNKS